MGAPELIDVARQPNFPRDNYSVMAA
jgi:hypothetical protein